METLKNQIRATKSINDVINSNAIDMVDGSKWITWGLSVIRKNGVKPFTTIVILLNR